MQARAKAHPQVRFGDLYLHLFKHLNVEVSETQYSEILGHQKVNFMRYDLIEFFVKLARHLKSESGEKHDSVVLRSLLT